MSIAYALITTTTCSIILAIFPKLIAVDNKPISRKKILGNTVCVYIILYILAPTPYLYPICVFLSIILSLLICLMIYFKVCSHLVKKSPSLIKKFENIDKMNGFEFEEFIAEILTLRGYRKVTLTKKTGDYGVDATCFPVSPKDNRKIAIQIKRYNSPVSVGAVQEIVAGAAMYKAEITIVITNSTYTNNAKILADSNNCSLIDRNILKTWVYESEKIKNKSEFSFFSHIKGRFKQSNESLPPTSIKKNNIANENKEVVDILRLFALDTEIDEIILEQQLTFLNFEPFLNKSSHVLPTAEAVEEVEATTASEALEEVEGAIATEAPEEVEGAIATEALEATTATEAVEEEEAVENIESTETVNIVEITSSETSNAKIDVELISDDLDELDVNAISVEALLESEGFPIEDELDGGESISFDFDIPD